MLRSKVFNAIQEAKLSIQSNDTRITHRFGRVLDDGGKLDAKHREDRVDDGDDG